MRVIRTLGECVAIGFMVLATASLAAGAGTSKRYCRATCDAAVESCVQQGFRKHFCTREVLALCVRGSTTCSVTSTTVPVCVTTTTTLPEPSGACLGPAGCDLDPS